MSQEQLNLIVKVLRKGVPVIADELVQCVINIINDNADLREKLKQMSTNDEENKEDK